MRLFCLLFVAPTLAWATLTPATLICDQLITVGHSLPNELALGRVLTAHPTEDPDQTTPYLSYNVAGVVSTYAGVQQIPFLVEQPLTRDLPAHAVSVAVRISPFSARGIGLMVDAKHHLWLLPPGDANPLPVQLDLNEDEKIGAVYRDDSVKHKASDYGIPFDWVIATNRRILRWTFTEIVDPHPPLNEGLHLLQRTVRDNRRRIDYVPEARVPAYALRAESLPPLLACESSFDCRYVIGKVVEVVHLRELENGPSLTHVDYLVAFGNTYLIANQEGSFWVIQQFPDEEKTKVTPFKTPSNRISAFTAFQHQGITTVVYSDERGVIWSGDLDAPNTFTMLPYPPARYQSGNQPITSLVAIPFANRPSFLANHPIAEYRRPSSDVNDVLMILVGYRGGIVEATERWLTPVETGRNRKSQASGTYVGDREWFKMKWAAFPPARRAPLLGIQNFELVPVLGTPVTGNRIVTKAEEIFEREKRDVTRPVPPRVSNLYEVAHRFETYLSYLTHEQSGVPRWFKTFGASQSTQLFILEVLTPSERERVLTLDPVANLLADRVSDLAIALESHISEARDTLSRGEGLNILHSLATALHFSETEFKESFLRWADEEFTKHPNQYPDNKITSRLSHFLREFIFTGNLLEIDEPEEPSPL